jgi:outer membrane protein assembly factor BamD
MELETGKRPKEALVYFQEVERLYPYSEWAKRALIMQAYSYHRAKEYEEARGAAQRFIDTYPGDEDAAYAKYLLALSYYDQIDEVGRDQGLTFQALQSLREVIEEYPDSEYARSAILKFDLAFDHLAARKWRSGAIT